MEVTLTNRSYLDSLETEWQQLSDDYKAIAEHEDPETKAFAEDVLAVEDGISDARKYATAQVSISEKLSRLNEEIQANINEHLFDGVMEPEVEPGKDAEAKELNEYLESVDITANDPLKNKVYSEEELRRITAESVAKHPIRFMMVNMNNAISELNNAIREVNGLEAEHCHLLKTGIDVITKETTALYGGTKVAVASTYHQAIIDIGGVLGQAYEKLGELAENTNKLLKKGLDKLCNALNMKMEYITGGRWSQFQQKIEARASEFVKRNEDLTMTDFKQYAKDLKLELADPELSGMDKVKTLYKETKKIPDTVAFLMVKASAFLSGKENDEYLADRVSYWAEVKNEIWGENLSPAEQFDIKVNDAKVKAHEMSEAMIAAPGKICEKIKESCSKAAAEIGQKAKEVHADALGLCAGALEQSANLAFKLEGRVSGKVEKLEKIDNQIFEAMQNINKEIHSLTEITPYVRKEYTPDPQIVNLIDQLKQMTPSSYINFQISLSEHLLEKQQAKFEKQEDKNERVINKTYQKAQDKISKLTADYFSLAAEQQENLAKIEKALGKLETLASGRETIEAKAKDLSEKADSMREDVYEEDHEMA